MPKLRKQITHETFHECVNENVREFDMSHEEAVADAIQQFESQGVDLSNIITRETSTGQDPELLRLKRLLSELQDHSNLESGQDQLVKTLAELERVCQAIPAVCVEAGHTDLTDTLLALLDVVHSDAVVRSCSNLLVRLCTENVDTKDCVGRKGMQRLVVLLNRPWEELEPVVQLIALVKALCHKHESNKAHFTKSKGVLALCNYLDKANEHDALSKQLALCLRVLTINDDPRATCSQAPDTIKLLIEAGMIPYTLDVVRRVKCKDAVAQVSSRMSPDLLIQWLALLKQLAVTKGTCQQIAECDALSSIQAIMQRYEHSAPITRRCISVLRNMAAADELKRVMVQSGGIRQTLLLMERHETDASVQQSACATLAAIALRSPENSHALVELGALHRLARAMQVHTSNTSVLRQASLAIRNMVARSAELRARFQQEEPELEPLLRQAQFYRGCGDEAYAALRDLGCEIPLSSFGTPAANKATEETTRRFNPVQIPSNQLRQSVKDVSEAPFVP
ncbi:hypothetical protein PsorP6_013098 [Peronosclerospora sorghi]|uniref:Uncharacterized protein n=1 Tax=Peronosclerospora sorghi TaxID=230839 RepID=A0ACC0WGV7_9STRA|nr:hypothetical protein PsorP6_013098 [Peronosclerospora sorghi]